MAAQNLVSGTIGPEKLTKILGEIGQVKADIGVFKTLQPESIHSIIKAGNGFAPFVERACRIAEENAELMPRLLDVAEFKRDFLLAGDLTQICEQLESLLHGVQDTLIAARSDAMVAALEVYATVKANSDRVPGFKGVASDLGEFFRKSKAREAAAAKGSAAAKA